MSWVKPWMKYVGVGLLGLIIGAAIGGGGATKTKTTTVTKTSPPRTVSRTVTVAPDAKTLAKLRSKVSDERATLRETRGKTSDKQAQLRRLTGAVSAAKVNTVSGTGTFLVGSDINPGTYRAAASPGCYWARLASLDTSNIVDNDNADGPVVVEILASDKAFQTNGCADFHKIG